MVEGVKFTVHETDLIVLPLSSPLDQRSRLLKRFLFLLTVLCLLCYRFSYKLLTSFEDGILQDEFTMSTNSTIPPSEIFEVTLPHPDFGVPVYSQKLLTHVFADSWGKPAIAEYSAPPSDTKFNKVVLRLNTSVGGVQYDRLAHLYLDGIAIWRTSTIEPGGRDVYSTATKDVSVYSKLFAKDNTALMFQLDNLITKRLTGAFNVTLEAIYYNAPQNISIVPKDYDDELSSPGSVKNFFGNSDPADEIWSLVESAPNRPPLVYQPSAELSSKLPRFNANTTRAKLELFMSGNAAEEFWYSNVLDDVKDSFANHNHPLLGHGPCRVANIYLNDLKIATLVPEPIIFTGGISPALWRPVVSSGAFDIRALEIELTPLLPLLWGYGSNELKVEVGNCIDENEPRSRKRSSIGENWITTANVLTWESPQVESSFGELIGNFNNSKIETMEIGGGGLSSTLTQIVIAKYKTYVQGSLNYNLKNGSSINVVSDSLTSMDFNNIQRYSQYGDKQDVVSTSTSHHSFSLIDSNSLDLVSQTNITHDYPLIVSIFTKPDGRDISYDVSLVRGSHALVKFANSSKPSIKVQSVQNGTSHYYLSPKGNHGTGKTEHRFKAITKDPLPRAAFKRHVLASNGEVLKDDSKWNEFDDDNDDAVVDFSTTLQVKNQDYLAMYNSISSHFQHLYDEGLLDSSCFEYMITHLIHSLNDDFGIASIQSNWNTVDKRLIPHMGLFQNFI